jgi:hypothetical protein
VSLLFPLFALAVLPANADLTEQLVSMERKIMDGWLHGDPEPLLASLDSEVTYIHAAADKRLEGIAAVRELCERFRGRPLFDRYEILEPKVQRIGPVAVLTYDLMSHVGGSATRWKGTLVYRQGPEGWRVVHTHWSTVANPPGSGQAGR